MKPVKRNNAKRIKQTEIPLSSLSKGLTLLIKLRELCRPLGLSEAARTMGFNKATTLRVLNTLEQHRFIEKNETQRKYSIGVNAFYVGSAYLTLEARAKIRSVMRKLVAESGHTVTVSVLDGVSAIFIDRIDGVSRVRVTVEIGSRVPAYASASGKALLAHQGDDEISKRFQGVKFVRFSDKTITTIDELISNLSLVRRRGFATNNEESTKGMCAIAVPIKNQSGAHIAALNIAFPAGSLTKQEQSNLVSKLITAAAEIESVAFDYFESTVSVGG